MTPHRRYLQRQRPPPVPQVWAMMNSQMTPSLHYLLFKTPVGPCGLLWSEHGLCAIQLPESSESATRQRIFERYPACRERAPSPTVSQAVALITELLHGTKPSLDQLVLDLRGVSPFCRKVYAAARQIPVGETISYGELAQRIGSPGAARAVGRALGTNPLPIVVPCHRVLAAGGKLGGFTAHGGLATKQRLLACERGFIV